MLVSRSSDTPQKVMPFQQADMKDLKRAKKLLEKPGISARLLNILGKSISAGFRFLPDKWNMNIGKLTQTALSKTVHAAIYSISISNM
jgi:hypothetical protein